MIDLMGTGVTARFDPIETPTRDDARVVVSTDAAVRAWADWVVTALFADDPFSYCGVLVHDPAAGVLRLVSERWRGGLAAEPPAEDRLVSLEGTVCGRVFRTSAPILVSDVRQHTDHRPLPRGAMRCELAVPVLRAGNAIAVINVESPRVGGLDISDLYRLTALSAEAAELAPVD